MLSTKKDLRDHLKAGETISSDEMKKAKKENGLIGLHDTTSKEWKDFNVHKAFNKSIKAAINYKYDDDEDEDSDDEEWNRPKLPVILLVTRVVSPFCIAACSFAHGQNFWNMFPLLYVLCANIRK